MYAELGACTLRMLQVGCEDWGYDTMKDWETCQKVGQPKDGERQSTTG